MNFSLVFLRKILKVLFPGDDINNTMRIETGSQNASRVPGNFAYVQHRYNPAEVESVGSIRGQAGRQLREAAAAQARPHPSTQAVMRDPVYEITHSTRAAKYLGTGSLVDRLA